MLLLLAGAAHAQSNGNGNGNAGGNSGNNGTGGPGSVQGENQRHQGSPTTDYVLELAPGHTISEITGHGVTATDSIPSAGLFLLRVPTPQNPNSYADSLEYLAAVDDADLNTVQSTPEAIRQMVLGAVGGFMTDFTGQSTTGRLHIDEAHHVSTGTGQIVAILDTGIDFTHTAFSGRLSPYGRDFVDSDYDASEDANGVDDDHDGTPDDGYGHGTMVAGLVSLVAPDAVLLPIRVLDDEGRGDAFTICKGIQYAVEQGATVINVSFGANTPLPVIADQLEHAQALGVVVVAGAGNNSSNSALFYPGAYPTSIMVTAVDSVDVKASFADYSSHVSVCAPGVNVRSSYPGNGWAMGSGCSFATPLVAGEVALIRSAFPGIDWQGVHDRLGLGAVPIDILPGNAAFRGGLGAGRIDPWYSLTRATTAVDASAGEAVAELHVRSLAGGAAEFVSPSSHGGQPARMQVLDATGRALRTWPAGGMYFVRWSAPGAAAHLARFAYLP